jgi:hypothetical protein
VPVVQAAFSPSAADVQAAMRLMTAYTEHQRQGKGAFIFEGKMIDAPTVLQVGMQVLCGTLLSSKILLQLPVPLPSCEVAIAAGDDINQMQTVLSSQPAVYLGFGSCSDACNMYQ